MCAIIIFMNTHFSIQQVSQMTGVSVHTLRYYEKIGLLEGVSRNEQGYRVYGESDLAWLEFLLRLRETGMPIREMKRYSDLRAEGDATAGERRMILEAHQQHIIQQIKVLQDSLHKINYKIDFYHTLEDKYTNGRREVL